MSGDRYKINDQNGIYFCTITVVKWIDIFTRKEYKDIIVDSFNYCIQNKGLELYSWVIMSNHIHFVGTVNPPHQFSHFLRDFKKHTSKAIIKEISRINESRKDWLLDKFSFEARRTQRAKKYKLWKDSNHCIEIDSQINIWQKVNYIHDNPVKSGIVDNPEDYTYSSSRDYSNGKGLIDVIVL
ncbi:REP-associated tyrosine transposase [Marinigracilibium pacificum]|uniref:Transposase n=1 Tax=Marinigracilibium pacificum TaxID=2729599 RepID=A0A848J438_9BACT|nr:transposase [Marinigracilibium pacificum]NMM47942.1 transposase [Marinigracilibium pacificum]